MHHRVSTGEKLYEVTRRTSGLGLDGIDEVVTVLMIDGLLECVEKILQ